MSRETIGDALAFLGVSGVKTLDITGGAPELHPHFRELVMLSLAALSLWTTSVRIRQRNGFSYTAIIEVAALFVGIFVCMQAPIQMLNTYGASLEWDERAAVTVVLASRGYPAGSSKGDVIEGLDPAGAEVTHAGTALQDGEIVTAGGRVLNVTALGEGREAARRAAYAAADQITFDGKTYRRDIAA